jgi:hypothetical protein
MVPDAFTPVLQAGAAFGNVSRMLAGSTVGPDDVIDASKHVDAHVVEAWLIERGQQFDVDGKMLVALSRAGVPGSVTDVMIGVSYPERFVLARDEGGTTTSGGGGGGGTPSRMMEQNGDLRACAQLRMRNPYRYSPYDQCDRYMDAYDDPFLGRYGYYNGYYYNGYYYGYGRYGYYDPIYTRHYSEQVVVIDRRKPEPPHGTLVNGQGYTRGRPPGAAGDGGSSSGSTTSGSSSSGRSSGSSSSGSSSSSGRTAHKKGG